MSDGTEFYANLAPVAAFDAVTESASYVPLPDDWVVLSGDIQGSTKAIAEGRYKAVNMVGAAVITAVLNACPGFDLPFVFGGDGGAVVVPPEAAQKAAEALQRLQAHSDDVFGLSLRAAAVPVARLRTEGSDLRVLKFALNGDNALAMFTGGGLDHVDDILKNGAPDDPDRLVPDPAAPPDLEGLSCRWEPLKAGFGRMIALMVRPAPGRPSESVYRDVLAQLRDVLDQNMRAHAPARDDTLRLRWPPRGLRIERRALALGWGAGKAWAWTAMTSVLQKIAHLRGVKIGDYDAPAYTEQLKAQTDFRKFDGALRVVLDCTEAQIVEIETWLEDAFKEGRLVYGLHVDQAALMTCLVFNLDRGAHVHFVDAAGGGFAQAAVGFKARLAALSPPQLPAGVAPYKRTEAFTATTVPSGLLKDHATKAGVWGVIHVQAGKVTYRDAASGAVTDLTRGQSRIVKPEERHSVALSDDAVFYVEFHR